MDSKFVEILVDLLPPYDGVDLERQRREAIHQGLLRLQELSLFPLYGNAEAHHQGQGRWKVSGYFAQRWQTA